MRVSPDYRGMGVSAKPTRGLFDWAAGAGASVCRNVVFKWDCEYCKAIQIVR